MAYQDKMLFRTSLGDTGEKNGHGAYCSSPDMIAHSFVSNPQLEFGGNYESDPNQPIDRSSKTNTIYVRVKGMQDSESMVDGFVRLYRASASLFMNTEQWKGNKLFTPKGDSYVKVSAGSRGEIAVGKLPFLVDGMQENFCMVGIVSESSAETLPNNFSCYSDFVSWVHSERCVAVRNFSLEASDRTFDYEALYNFSNPEKEDRLGSILVKASGLPDGTLFGMSNEALGIGKSAVFCSADSGTHRITDSAYLEADFDGFIRIYAKLPPGAKWPAEAVLETSFWISAEDGEDMLRFACPAADILPDVYPLMGCNRGRSDVGQLVKVGSCTTMFV